ncbi:tetratricopeptide repeat protein, partial [Flavobacterium circumlabens]
KENNVNDVLYDCYNLLGILYNEQEEYGKALELHEMALNTLADKSIPADFQLEATSLNNIGFVYLRMQNYSKAKLYFQQSLNQKNLFEENTTLYAIVLDNLAYSKFKLKQSDGL